MGSGRRHPTHGGNVNDAEHRPKDARPVAVPARFDVETSGLRSAGGSAETVAADLRGLAGEIGAALAGVSGAAPPQSAAATGQFSQTIQTGALAIGDSVGSIGANAVSAADAYEQVDRQGMPR
jgi:hypothetical protein